MRFKHNSARRWKFSLPNCFAIDRVCKTDGRESEEREINTKIESRVSLARRSQKSEPNWGCQRRRKQEKVVDKIENRWILHALHTGSVIAGRWNRVRATIGNRTRGRERGHKNVRCTCLYLFCIITSLLPREHRGSRQVLQSSSFLFSFLEKLSRYNFLLLRGISLSFVCTLI